MPLPIPGATIRPPSEADHSRVVAALPSWWPAGPATADGDRLASLAQRLFFRHFATSSSLVERDGELLGFLIGFLSPTHPDEGYIHLVGVSPTVRGSGLARHLYQEFFDYCRASGRTRVRAVTSPGNAGSYAFHTALGFVAEPGQTEFDGRPVQVGYDGPGLDRVSFVRSVS
jgi:predicted GNAT superfamily acetyltransferase